jgi:dolichyl-diphosphooligosaccharide--protein glycosyltransferase
MISLIHRQVILIDDYRQAYWWLRDQTPQDARVMAWWVPWRD